MNISNDFVIPNTLGVASRAVLGCVAANVEELRAAQVAAAAANLPFVVLGAGSNIVPLPKVRAFVCRHALRGIRVLDEDEHSVHVTVGAAENWHGFVLESLRRGWFGIENLALIPGSVGAAPVQNIGAYGVEISSFVESVTVLDADGRELTMNNAECRFGYRESVFKSHPGRIILSVDLRLLKRANPHIDYPDLIAELGGAAPSPSSVADAVIAIRQRKLPDPATTPNAGSFFKNPVVPVAFAKDLQMRVPSFKAFPAADGLMKLSAAQLIDQAGWKARGTTKVACWPKQPLVLTNIGGADGEEVLAFANAVRDDIRERYAVQLELEPCVLS